VTVTATDIGEATQWVAYGVFAAGSVALAVIDARTKLLPNRIVFPLYGVGLVGLTLAAGLDHKWSDLLVAVVAMVLLYGLFAIPWLFGGTGFGDVKLAGVLGLFLGWRGVPPVYVGLLIATVSSSLVAVALSVWRAARHLPWRRQELAYGPYLLFGAWAAIAISLLR
jgi:leader peptidase (prepilin peptidase) / N-methyltransferase